MMLHAKTPIDIKRFDVYGFDMKSAKLPIGRQLAMTTKMVTRAFEDALTETGGGMPSWFILQSLMEQEHRAQTDLAASVGIQGPTLTHHLNSMETEGLLTRTRDPENRRVHQVALTAAGRAKFQQMRTVAIKFDHQLCAGFSREEINTLREILRRFEINVGSVPSDSFPACPE